MKRFKTLLFATALVFTANAQTSQKKVYDEDINPAQQIDQALTRAKARGKFVVCQVGGNWCPWCLRFADFITNDTAISKVIDEMPISLIHDENIYHSISYDVAFIVDDYNIVTAVSIQPSNPVGRFEILGIWAEMDDDDCEDILYDLGFSYIGKTSGDMYVYELGSYRIGVAYDANYRVKQCMLIRKS
jgi:hypothetical protein